MKNLLLAAVLAVSLSGCLGTVAIVGGSLAAGVGAGCSTAAANPNTSQSALSEVCGSAFAP